MNRTAWRIPALLIVMALIFAACGESDTTTTTATEATTATTVAETATETTMAEETTTRWPRK